MSFEIDRETFNDLEIINQRSASASVYSLFDKTKTEGGTRLLFKMMQEPSSDYQVLIHRRDSINFFYHHKLQIDITHHQLDMIDHYLDFNKRCLGNNFIDAVYDHYAYKVNPTTDYYIILTGIRELIKLFRFFSVLVPKILNLHPPEYLSQKLIGISNLLDNPEIKKILSSDKNVNCYQVSAFDNLFRDSGKQAVKAFITFVYEADVLESVAGVMKNNDWCFAQYRTDKTNELEIKGLVHPCLNNPVNNDILLDAENTLTFITGPNMAGKSSFLKAVGIAVYLAHIGFPIPARSMKTPIYKGLITTINLPDNISEGLSHYYSEIKRIKKTASKLLEKGSLFVVFDELFKGTNLIDAFEATLLVTSTLAQIRNSKFMISSHFTELTDDLKKIRGVSFKYFDCTFKNEQPEFTYKLKNGISEERLGMYILRNEGVVSILEQVISKEQAHDRLLP